MSAPVSEAALLVIDMQLGLVTGAHRESETLEAVNLVMSKARAANVPIVFVQHHDPDYPPLSKGEPGWQLHPTLERKPEDLVVDKRASDAFYETDLAGLLAEAGAKLLYVTGMQTEFCVDATCRAALSRDFDVVLVADGHTTGDAALDAVDIIRHHNVTLANLAHPVARLATRASADISFDKHCAAG